MDLTAPRLRTRLSCLVYEGLMMFGVVFGAGLLYSIVMQQRHALAMRAGMQAWLFLVIGFYFIWFWSRGRQTLPMKTWHIALVDELGQALSYRRALLRYLFSWLWFLPAALLAWLAGAGKWPTFALLGANMMLWAMTIYLDPQRQYLHDRLAGTRMIARARRDA
ncbi:MAG: hypothetical protein JWP36_2443 [Paucimonas sp.]|nr:hypothetical protein [Paucimonas sp.]